MSVRISGNFSRSFPYRVLADLPGFVYEDPTSKAFFLSPRERTAIDWFDEFFERCVAATGRHFLPVYRMADGEFQFMVGQRPPFVPTPLAWLRYIKSTLVRTISTEGMRTCWGETYTKAELDNARQRFVSCLRQIAAQGILAMNFVSAGDEKPKLVGIQYYEPVLNWLQQHGITLTDRNYYPFYFVYAMLSDWHRNVLLAKRNVLVITSLTEDKKTKLAHNLMANRAASVQFQGISPNKAMLDKISLSAVQVPVDLVLIGAGIGAANILCQLEPLNTLCIDAGFALNCFADPSLRGKRPFTLAGKVYESEIG